MRVRLSEALAAQQLKKFFGMPPAHICIVLTFYRAVAKIAPTIDDLLGGTAADSQLQAAARDQIRSSSVLRHVMRILIPHIDHRGANFNLSRFSTHRREQRKRGCEVLRKMMNPEVGSFHSEALGFHGEVNGLQECVSR